MFSSRLPWDAPRNRLSQAFEARRRAGAGILDLTESNPTRAGFSYPAEDLLAAVADARALVYEPAPAGLASARQAVAGWYRERGYAVDPSRILLTAGTSEAYAFLFKLLANPGEEVLVPVPSYPLFDHLAALESVRLRPYPLHYDHGWLVDTEALAAAVTPATRAVIVVSPNNPTGSYLKRRELEALIAVCSRHDLALIADEVFADYALGPDPDRAPSLAGCGEVLAFALNGLSKCAGLPQMKLGWIVAGGPDELRPGAFERLELIADAYLSVGAPVQHALPRLLEAGRPVQEQIAARVRANLEALTVLVGCHSECELLRVEGGWYAVLRVPRTRGEEDWCLELLERDGVLVQPGFFYDFPSEAFLVLSLLTPPEVFAEGVGRLLRRVQTAD